MIWNTELAMAYSFGIGYECCWPPRKTGMYSEMDRGVAFPCHQCIVESKKMVRKYNSTSKKKVGL